MHNKLSLAVIYGSSRQNRFCDTVVDWLRSQLAPLPDFLVDWIDPLQAGLPHSFAVEDEPGLQHYLSRIETADAFIIVTPEYNHGYPAVLKHLIDAAYVEWRAKPVGFVSYGGMAGGARAVEQLRLVFAELSAVGLRDTVSFRNPWERLDADGRLLAGPGAEHAMQVLVQQLRWWGLGLRQLRQTLPITVAA